MHNGAAVGPTTVSLKDLLHNRRSNQSRKASLPFNGRAERNAARNRIQATLGLSDVFMRADKRDISECADVANAEISRHIIRALEEKDSNYFAVKDTPHLKAFLDQAVEEKKRFGNSEPSLQELIDTIYRNFDTFKNTVSTSKEKQAVESAQHLEPRDITEELRRFVVVKQQLLFTVIRDINHDLSAATQSQMKQSDRVRNLTFNEQFSGRKGIYQGRPFGLSVKEPTPKKKQIFPPKFQVQYWIRNPEDNLDSHKIVIPHSERGLFDDHTLSVLGSLVATKDEGKHVKLFETTESGDVVPLVVPKMDDAVVESVVPLDQYRAILLGIWRQYPNMSAEDKKQKIETSLALKKAQIIKKPSEATTASQKKLIAHQVQKEWDAFKVVLNSICTKNEGKYVYPSESRDQSNLIVAAKKLTGYLELVRKAKSKSSEVNKVLNKVYKEMEKVKFASKHDVPVQEYLLHLNPRVSYRLLTRGVEALKQEGVDPSTRMIYANDALGGYVRTNGFDTLNQVQFIKGFDASIFAENKTKGVSGFALILMGGESVFEKNGGTMLWKNPEPESPAEPEDSYLQGVKVVHENIKVITDAVSGMDDASQNAFIDAYCSRIVQLSKDGYVKYSSPTETGALEMLKAFQLYMVSSTTLNTEQVLKKIRGYQHEAFDINKRQTLEASTIDISGLSPQKSSHLGTSSLSPISSAANADHSQLEKSLKKALKLSDGSTRLPGSKNPLITVIDSNTHNARLVKLVHNSLLSMAKRYTISDVILAIEGAQDHVGSSQFRMSAQNLELSGYLMQMRDVLTRDSSMTYSPDIVTMMSTNVSEARSEMSRLLKVHYRARQDGQHVALREVYQFLKNNYASRTQFLSGNSGAYNDFRKEYAQLENEYKHFVLGRTWEEDMVRTKALEDSHQLYHEFDTPRSYRSDRSTGSDSSSDIKLLPTGWSHVDDFQVTMSSRAILNMLTAHH